MQTKSKKRIKDYGEVYTAEREVNAMLDLVKGETERIDSRFLEPACGNGNFLVEILRRKLESITENHEKNTIIAVASIYGVDILQDNIDESKQRMLEVVYNSNIELSDKALDLIKYILDNNIICGNTLTTKTIDGLPIIFIDWEYVNNYELKKRYCRLDKMLE